MDVLLKIPYYGFSGVLPVLSAIIKKIAVYVSGAFIVVAVFDYFFQRHQHIKKLKMTKDEVKKEYKEMEGDPLIKSKRKQLHRELAMNDTIQRASNVLDGYKLVTTQAVDKIIIDLALHAADTLIETLHTRRETSHIPVYIVKASSQVPLALRRLCTDILEAPGG